MYPKKWKHPEAEVYIWSSSEVDDADLTRRGFVLDYETPDRECHWCGRTDEDEQDYGGLTDFTVECSVGEEGHARVTRYACEGHLQWLMVELPKLGFYVHNHGGICFLEATTCPAFEKSMRLCPTPETAFGEPADLDE